MRQGDSMNRPYSAITREGVLDALMNGDHLGIMEVLSDLRIPEAPLDKVRVCGGPSSAREETNDGGEKVGRGRRGGGWCDGLDL
uniref:Uncharacterized protein n=1 Tax=Pristionchus pacificus TaxID=54126 RepID=A0A2A6B9C6_PRIPA|eukprot:PDM62463.1 hypothetical protein PRIPAC_51905 [Pristionchus pacificus]